VALITANAISLKGRFSYLSFTASKGEMLFLLGPNGAGKSSLLSVLSGYTAHKGEIKLDNKPLSSLSPYTLANLRAWLPQQAQIDAYISITQAFELALFPLGLSLQSPNVEAILSSLFDSLDLQKLKNRLIGQLSGGEQQRVQIGLRLIQVWPELNPQACLLLLDEPTNGLDLNHQKALFMLLNQLKQQGLSIIICVHDLNLALSYADSVLMIKDGMQSYFGDKQGGFRPEIIEAVFEVKGRILEHKGKQHLILD